MTSVIWQTHDILLYPQKFDTIESAYNFADTEELEDPLIFVHTGTYRSEFLLVDSQVSLIGAGKWLFMLSINTNYINCIMLGAD